MKLEASGMGPLCEVDANMENGNIEDEIAGSTAERSSQAKAVIEAEEASMPFKEGQDHYLISARSERHSVHSILQLYSACRSA